MKVNIHNPTNQKSPLFSSWRVFFWILCVCASFCSSENYSWSTCNGDAEAMRRKPVDSMTLYGSVLALPLIKCDLGKVLNPMCLGFFICKMDIIAAYNPKPHRVETRIHWDYAWKTAARCLVRGKLSVNASSYSLCQAVSRKDRSLTA